eukprot:s1922_g11.t1
MTLELEDVFASSWPSGGKKQVAFEEIDVVSRGATVVLQRWRRSTNWGATRMAQHYDGSSFELIRCNSSVDAIACVQTGWLHLFRSKEELLSWPMEEGRFGRKLAFKLRPARRRRGAMGNVGTRSQCCSGSPIGDDVNDRGDDVGADGPEALGALTGKGSKTSLTKPQEERNAVNSQESSKDFDRARRRTRTWVQDVPSSVRSFMVKVTKPLGKEKTAKLGLDIDYAEESTALPVVDVNGGLVGQSGDCIVAVNGIQKDVPNMLKSLTNVGQLELLVVKGTTSEQGSQIGTEPVASGLLAAEGYYQQVESQQMVAAANDKEVAPQAPVPGAPQTVESAEELARTLAKKRTLNWFALVEVAVSKNRIATVLQNGQLLVWRESQGLLVEEVRILFPEPPSIVWCPDEKHMLCCRHAESFLFLLEGLTQGSCLDCMGEVRSFSCEVEGPDALFITSAAFATVGDFFAAAWEGQEELSSLSMWRWNPAVPLLASAPRVSLASSIHLSGEVSKLCFASSEAGEELLVLCASELRIFAFNDIDLVLMPKRVLSFGAASVADMTSAGLLVAKGKKFAYVSLGDASFSFQATLPSPVAQLALGGACPTGPMGPVLAQRGGSGKRGRCYFLAFEPVLTKEMARFLRLSYLKYWERSMAQLQRSCGKQIAGKLKATAYPNDQNSAQTEVLQRLLREVQGLQTQVQAVRLSLESSSSADQLGLGQALESLMPQVVDKLGERLADPEDGQLFHERFLAAFPVQGDDSMDELHRELQGFSDRLRNLLQEQLSKRLPQCCEQWRPNIWQCGEILTDALDEAVMKAPATMASSEAKQAVQRVYGSAQKAFSCTEELRQATREALSGIVRECKQAEAAAPVTGRVLQLKGLRQCALPLQESLEQLAREVKETQESLRRLAEPGDAKEVNGHGISP